MPDDGPRRMTDAQLQALLAVAGRVGTTRLIDNIPVLVGPGGGALEVFSDVPAVRP